jgi:ABC-type glycerol-3-phosphate transport system permease component
VAVPAIRRALPIVGSYAALLVGAFLLLLPFGFQLSTSLKNLDQVFVFPIQWIPNPFQWGNFPDVFQKVPFTQYILNTMLITAFGVVGSLTGSTLAAYPFARMRFPGRRILFAVMLATLMVPAWVTLIPQFLLFRVFGWMDTYYPFIVPAFAAHPFYTFLLRQFFMTIPTELDQAAKLDGAGSFRILTQILLPLSAPALASVGIFSFLGYWNDFLGPVIYLSTPSKFTLSVGIAYFQGVYRVNFPLMMAAATMAMLPPVVLFFLAQRWFIEGVTMTGLKG